MMVVEQVEPQAEQIYIDDEQPRGAIALSMIDMAVTAFLILQLLSEFVGDP